MALVKCPACGNMVSENANSCPHCGEPIKAAKMSGEVDSGTESFSVEGKNRIHLAAEADVKIKSVSERLSAQGKTVVNIQRSEPQAISVGVTLWRMDVTIIWNASLDSQRYQQTIYEQAKSYQSSGNYSKAIETFDRVKHYSDSEEQIRQCKERIEQQNKAKAEAEAYHKEVTRAVGSDPSENSGCLMYFFGIPILIGVIGIFMCLGSDNLEGNMGLFIFCWVMLIGGIIPIVVNRIHVSKYNEKLAKYMYNKNRKNK